MPKNHYGAMAPDRMESRGGRIVSRRQYNTEPPRQRDEQTEKDRKEAAAFSTSPSTVFRKEPEDRLQWLEQALLHVGKKTIKAGDLYEIVMHESFVEGVPSNVGAQMRAILLANLHVFASKQQKSLESEAKSSHGLGRFATVVVEKRRTSDIAEEKEKKKKKRRKRSSSVSITRAKEYPPAPPEPPAERDRRDDHDRFVERDRRKEGDRDDDHRRRDDRDRLEDRDRSQPVQHVQQQTSDTVPAFDKEALARLAVQAKQKQEQPPDESPRSTARPPQFNKYKAQETSSFDTIAERSEPGAASTAPTPRRDRLAIAFQTPGASREAASPFWQDDPPSRSTSQASTSKLATAQASTSKSATAQASTSKSTTAQASTSKSPTAQASTSKSATAQASTSKSATAPASTSKSGVPPSLQNDPLAALLQIPPASRSGVPPSLENDPLAPLLKIPPRSGVPPSLQNDPLAPLLQIPPASSSARSGVPTSLQNDPLAPLLQIPQARPGVPASLQNDPLAALLQIPPASRSGVSSSSKKDPPAPSRSGVPPSLLNDPLAPLLRIPQRAALRSRSPVRRDGDTAGYRDNAGYRDSPGKDDYRDEGRGSRYSGRRQDYGYS